MLSLNVKSNARAFTRDLNKVQRRQIPFATSKAINDTLFEVRKHIVNRVWPGSVTVRNRRFMSAAMRIEKSTKRTLTGRLFDKLGRASLSKHVDGGTKRPRGGSIAVPTDEVKRTKSGKVRKSQTPRGLKANPRAFKTRLKSGTEAIMQKVGGKKQRRLKVLYTLHATTRISRRFPFYAEADRMARRRFNVKFKRAMRHALRTAR